jgi:hypothetical protein
MILIRRASKNLFVSPESYESWAVVFDISSAFRNGIHLSLLRHKLPKENDRLATLNSVCTVDVLG